MTAINGLETSKGLDLILHKPGGDTAAIESIVDEIGRQIYCKVIKDYAITYYPNSTSLAMIAFCA